MKNVFFLKLSFFLFFVLALALSNGQAQWFLDVEGGAVFPGYIDVRVPGDTGTDFSMTDDLTTSAPFYFRFRGGYRFHPRHSISVLIAPLTINTSGQFDEDVHFNEVVFPAGIPVEGTYKFNSYRLTYRFELVNKESFQLGLGLTAKIRDAAIILRGDGLESEETDFGFVPLLNFRLHWRFSRPLSFLLEGDAAAASQGRAEDILVALVYQKSENWSFRIGYRILEGGADVEEVYNFALFHYLSFGASFHF